MKNNMWTIFAVAFILGLMLALVCNIPQEEPTNAEALELMDLFPKPKVTRFVKPLTVRDLHLIYDMYFDEELVALRLEMEAQGELF
jgi:hypothetical protein